MLCMHVLALLSISFGNHVWSSLVDACQVPTALADLLHASLTCKPSDV